MHGNETAQKPDKTGTQSRIEGVLVYQKKPKPYLINSKIRYTTRALQKYCNTFSIATDMQFFCISLDGSSFFDVFILSFGKRKINLLFGIICCSFISLPFLEKMEGFFRLYLIP